MQAESVAEGPWNVRSSALGAILRGVYATGSTFNHSFCLVATSAGVHVPNIMAIRTIIIYYFY
jgi:hypothetical protein